MDAPVTERLSEVPEPCSATTPARLPGVSDHGDGRGSNGDISDAEEERLLDPPFGP